MDTCWKCKCIIQKEMVVIENISTGHIFCKNCLLNYGIKQIDEEETNYKMGQGE